MRYSLTLEEVRQRCAKDGRVALYRELLADLDTPVSAYLKIAGGDRGFLLESVEHGERSARYSFLGGEPRAMLVYDDGHAVLQRAGQPTQRAACTDPLLALADMLGPTNLSKDGLSPFCGGAVGYLGFEVVGCFERLSFGPPAEPAVPEAVFMLADPVIAFDHVLRMVRVISTVSSTDEEGIDASYAAAVALSLIHI